MDWMSWEIKSFDLRLIFFSISQKVSINKVKCFWRITPTCYQVVHLANRMMFNLFLVWLKWSDPRFILFTETLRIVSINFKVKKVLVKRFVKVVSPLNNQPFWYVSDPITSRFYPSLFSQNNSCISFT